MNTDLPGTNFYNTHRMHSHPRLASSVGHLGDFEGFLQPLPRLW